MLYGIYRQMRKIPALGSAVNFALRVMRRYFWSYRPVGAMATAAKPPEDFLLFLEKEIVNDGLAFTVMEVGSGDGRTLQALAERYPHGNFVGVDLQHAAVAAGSQRLAAEGVKNVKLVCASCLDDAIKWDCDYLISRTALIYLDRKEVEMFLRKSLLQVRRKLLLEEIVSTTGKTEVSHFFAHALAELLGRLSTGQFSVSSTLLNYVPWKKEGRWSGAMIVLKREIL